ncbi:glycosyltransferase [Demequina activiva]|uniref:Glycosyltransferase, GT2 family n=1 Tax=Demequina activiva TaxID=1582364 RepID=A0A919Q5R3_9MICO|nr:glycosyltransferase [Demequina activiva]GIG55386.1 hypothetical protein Dac01nite_21380 [Demequina activiva]
MSPARIIVRAVMVTDGRSPHLAAALDAVLSQDPAPDAVHLALVADLDPPAAGWDPRVEVQRVDAPDYGAAVQQILDQHEGDGSELIWLLHDDMAPMPGSLAALTATARKRQLAGVVGAAQVQWDAPDRLVGLGTTTTRVGARRIGLVERDDVDQGQYAERDDVLAVSLGGALVRRELWDVLGAPQADPEGWTASLDYCRRAWRAGFDVVAVPHARIRHSQERLYGRRDGAGGGRRATYGTRRAAEWFHACVYAPWWAPPFLVLWAILASLARAVLRIAQNEPRLLIADLLVPWRLLGLLLRLPSARARARRAGRSTAAELRLLAGPRQVARHVRALEWGARSRIAARQAPSDAVRAELAGLATRRRLALATLALALVSLSVSLHPSWLPGLVRGQMLTGSILGVTDTSLGVLWDRALTGWSDQAFGAPAIDGGLATLLLPFAAAPGGLAVWLGAFLLLAPLLAGLTAWAATGAFTRSLWARGLAAAAYALWPIALESAAAGRVGAVIVHVVAPLAVLGLVRAGGWHRPESLSDGAQHPPAVRASRSAAMGAAAALAIVVMASPVLLVLVLVVVAIAGTAAGRARWRVWGAALPPLAVSGASLAAALGTGLASGQAWAILAREPGPSGQAEALSAADLLLGGIGETGSVPAPFVWALRALPVLMLAAAVAGALVGRRRWLSAGALGSVAVAVLAATAVQGLTLSPDAGADSPAPSGWYGSAMSIAALGSIVVAAAAWRPHAADRPGGMRRATAVVAIIVVAGAAVGSAAAQVWPGRAALGDVSPADADVLPLVAALEQGTDQRQRVLVLDSDPDGVVFAVLGTDGADAVSTAGTLLDSGQAAVRGPDSPPLPGPASLSDAVAALVAGRDEGIDALAQWGIGVLVAAPGADGIADVLAQSPDLRLMGAADRGTSWRVGAAEGDARVSRATFVGPDTVPVSVPMGRTAADWQAPAAGTLVIAEAADDAWTATLDGAPLAGTGDELGRQVFSVPEAGHVHVQYDDRTYRVWFWAGVVTVAWSLVAAIPVPSRRAREEDS